MKKKIIQFDSFKNLATLIKPLRLASFKKKPENEKNILISELLYKQIKKTKAPCFLLPAAIEFIESVNKAIKPYEYTFSHFEFWLNQFSNLSEEENYLTRSKITGKHIPRDEYQILFPVGSGKVYPGSHYVTAHGSPDLDTTIASFWGWVDAFSARVSEGLHIWNMPPGGVMASNDAAPLTDYFGKNFIPYFSQNRSSLSPRGIDFTSQKALIKKHLKDSSISPEDHERHKNAVMVLDSEGFYIGDLRNEDYESIRQILRIVTNNLKWFESSLQSDLTKAFAKKGTSLEIVREIIQEHFDKDIIYSADKRQLTDKLKNQIDQYFQNILEINQGISASFKEFGQALKKQGVKKLASLEKELENAFLENKVFGAKGNLLNKREPIFKTLDEISSAIDHAFDELRSFMDTMEMAIQIKRKVFNFPARYVTPTASLEEIIDKIGLFSYLSVVYPNHDGTLFPLGVIKAKEIHNKSLGTVTVRDFCNRSEVKIDSNLEIISAIDHHKAELKTNTPPAVLTSDVQSCNILVAELAFHINDRYSKSLCTPKQLKKEIESFSKKPLSNAIIRQKNRLLQKALANTKPKEYFIHPDREAFEYLSFIHAIIDDTDLFSKATKRDVYCTASLLNRLQSLEEKKEVEIIHFDSLNNEESFVKDAVQKIVKNKKMYSIYKDIYSKREKSIEHALVSTASGKSMEVFSDTKEQNGCCRISQSKLFAKNVPTAIKYFEKLVHVWLNKAKEVYSNHESIDLHIHMMSTIPSAEDVYKGGEHEYDHKDTMWIWAPDTNQAIHHLTAFLNAFKNSPAAQTNNIQYQVLSNSEADFQNLLKHHFSGKASLDKVKLKKKAPIIVLSFDAGTLNSRKAQITPYLPTLVK